MSNKIIVLWGTVVTLLILTIYVIGVLHEEEIKYIKLKEEVKTSVNKYIEMEEVKLPLEITTEELEEKEYIGELKLEDKICAADIKVDKKWIFKTFDIKFECVKVGE